MSEYTVVKGTTGPIINVYSDAMTSTTGWTCHMVLTDPGGNKVIDRPVLTTNTDNTKFVAFISEADSNTLAVEIYDLQLTLANDAMSPPFEAVKSHTIIVDPSTAGRVGLQLVRGENSFTDYATLIDALGIMPELYGAHGVSRERLKSAAVESWYDIGCLAADFDNGITTTRYFDNSVLDALTATQRGDLTRAMLQQTDYLLTTHRDQREATVRRITAGESSTVYRNNQAVVVCSDALRTLAPYLTPGQRYTSAVIV